MKKKKSGINGIILIVAIAILAVIAVMICITVIPKKDAALEKESTGNKEATAITQDVALEAIKNYCFENNPDLEGMADSDDYTIYFDVSTNEAGEIVVLYRSYTGAQTRYYVDPASGDVYVTELVPGIIDEETRTEETFNIKDYQK